MKKIVLFLMFLSTIIFSETLERVTYRNGVYTAIFRENKRVNSKATYNQQERNLTLDFSKLKIRNNIPRTMRVNDQFIDSVSITEVAGVSTISFYLKEGTEYRILSQNKQTQVIFSRPKEKKETQPKVKKKRYKIVVDAGHGGHDNGAVGNGFREKDIALEVAKKLASELRKDFDVIMTRNSDVFISLQERANIGNRNNADLFVSIHLNSAKSSSANGAEVFYYSRNESAYAAEIARYENSFDKSSVNIPFSELIINDIFYRINQQKSAAIATDVLNSIVNNFSMRRRGVFGANFAVLRGSNSPSILIELGFMSNYGDVSQFISSSNQDKAAKGIANAIRKHFD